MWGIGHDLKDAALRPVRHAMSRAMVHAGELAVIGVAALLTLCFALVTLVIWMAQLWGALTATAVMAAGLMILTLALYALHSANAAARQRQEEARAAAGSSLAVAFALGERMWRMAGMLAPRERRSAAPRALGRARGGSAWLLLAAVAAMAFVGGRIARRD